jgi:hypothetical protein
MMMLTKSLSKRRRFIKLLYEAVFEKLEKVCFELGERKKTRIIFD